MASQIAIPIPAIILNTAVAIVPIVIAIFGTTMEVSDYIRSGSFLRAAQLLPSCCDTYDFIIVGGGSAGAAIAARLSENPSVSVLLLEAGGNPNPVTYLPAGVVYLHNHPSVDWQHKTTSQKGAALGGINQQVPWPRGKSLGGSSNSNFMIYMRGNPRDFDRWADHTGDSRWKYKNVDRYFRKMEDYFGFWDGNVNSNHSKGGPLRIEKAKFTKGLDFVLGAASEMGYEIRDHNRGDQRQGFAPLDFTQKRGTRFSTYRAYIKPNLDRQNLVIFRYSLATKIHLDEHHRAVGVTYLRHGIKGYASASKEIIVCGGTINSPQLLMLSGIGPSKHLRQVGIEPLVDLPVGNNLQDHVSTAAGPFLLNNTESFMLQRDVNVGALLDFMTNGKGPLTSPAALIANGLISSEGFKSDWPDIMYSISVLGLFPMLPQILDRAFQTGKLADKLLSPDLGKDNHVILVTLGLPKSRGYIRLRDSNPLHNPIINPRYYSDRENRDIKAMVKAMQFIVAMYENTTSLQRLNAHLAPRHLPGCEKYKFKSPAYYECHVRTVTLTLYHPTSTCSMGKPDDPNSVVDSQLRVRGVRNLRVADASVMPYVTNSNTNAPSIMIGEMCADMVKRSWGI